jgi:hypothetical protein
MSRYLESLKPTVEILKDTSSVGISWVGKYSLMVLGAGALFAVTGAWAAEAVFGTPFFTALSVLALCVATLILSFVLWSAGRVGDWLADVIVEGVAWSKIHRQKVVKIETTPTTETAYLPTEVVEPRTIPVKTPDRAGELTLDYVNGFDPRDIAYFAKYLALGGVTSESRLEHLPLLHEGGQWGGLTVGTASTRILDLCEKRGILTPRDKARRKPGTLLIPNEQEILRLLLQEGE